MYRIGYVNANSLPHRKFAQAICLLQKSFDILFIAEHWYLHHENRLSHPLVHCSTTPPLRSNQCPPRGRQHAGIYLMVKPHIRPLILSTTSTAHSITVSLPGLHFAAVYYPAYSIQEDGIKHSLNTIGPVDLLLGDIHTTFPSAPTLTTTRSHSSSTARSLLFQTWAVKYNMIHIQDDSQKAKSYKIPDHVFASVLLRSNVTLSLLSTQSLQFKTDH